MQEESTMDLVAEKADSDLMAIGKLPADAPTWAKDPNVVKSGPSASKKSARKRALAQATQMLMNQYSEEHNGVGTWQPDIETLAHNVVTREYTGEIPWNLTAGTDFKPKEVLPDTAYVTYMQVDAGPQANAAIYRQWKQEVSDGRLESVTFVFGGLTAAIALFATYLRIEKRGFLRRTVRFASLITAAGLGITSTIAGAEAFSQSNHHYNSNGHRHRESEEHRTAHQSDPMRMSQFAGIPLSGHRIGFVVLGDHRFAEGNKIESVAKEINRCVTGFENVDYRVFCESDQGLKLTRKSRNPRTRTIRQTLARCFTNRAQAVLPRNAINNLKSFDPDQIILIRDADTELDTESDLQSLARLFRNVSGRVNVIELDNDRSASRAVLSKLASMSGGKCVVWPGNAQ